MDSRDLLRRLGEGHSIDSICNSAGWSRSQFDAWWREEAGSRAPNCHGTTPSAVRSEVVIERDRFGIPHVFAEHRDDLWFGFGYAMAQDRLFQLDYLRRKGLGRLAEILGPTALPQDLVVRIVGLNRIARDELSRIPDDTRLYLEAFARGITAWIEDCPRLPIEFDLLGYRPEPWSALDSMAIENEFRWYLTGRFPVIVAPELVKRELGDGPLYHEFLLGEADDEPVVPPDAYAGMRQMPHEAVGHVMSDPDGTGSNNWVVAGRHAKSGSPMVASDPHIAFEAVSCWYQAHLCGDGFNVAGMAYVGMPAIMFGRNERVAWGITNNICSLRDLYQERTDPAHPGCLLFDGRWEPARELVERIDVKGEASVERTVRFSRNGPIVDEILPSPADRSGPVSLKWLGAHQGGWLTALLGIDRAGDLHEFRAALKPWHVPTFNLVIADVEGHIAVQASGRIPLRKSSQRGYRPGWDPEHQWLGLLPFEAMPHAIDPSRGWLASANNRLAGDGFPFPLHGCWSSGYRAQRIREMIEAGLPNQFSLDDFGRMHCDTLSLRAVNCIPSLLKELAAIDDPRTQQAIHYLHSWDGRVAADLVAPTLFNVFYTYWSRAVTHVRFSGPALELIAKLAEGFAGRLLSGDSHGWFAPGERVASIRRVFIETVDELSNRFGPDMAQWQWGRLHRMPLKHVLSGRGDLGVLLDQGGAGVDGDMLTVSNTGSGPEWLATSGAGYRLVADLATNGLWAIDAQSQSGHPATPHYSDQFESWSNGNYHFLSLERAELESVSRMVLSPDSP